MRQHSLFPFLALVAAARRKVSLRPLAGRAGLALLLVASVAGEAPAQCVNGSDYTDCVGTVNNSASIGTGQPGLDDDWTVMIGDGVTPTLVTQDGNTVISLYDDANITIRSQAVVQGDHPNTHTGGHFGSGPNVIEFNSHSTVTIEAGGAARQLGGTIDGEAVNAHGFGNSIINHGTIYSRNGAAMWFQDVRTSPSDAERNTVVNYGTIATGKGDGYNVFGSSRHAAGPGLVFNNYGTVKGSLKFGNGNDSLLFGPGSVITGNVDGGGGSNDLTLDANLGESATLSGSVRNFSSITKIGEGAWAILGQVPASTDDPHPSSPYTGTLKGVDSLAVANGSLALVGANPDFTGTVRIEAPGRLYVQAQGVNAAASMENDGALIFDQAFDDAYTGSAITGGGRVVKVGVAALVMSPKAENTYSGGTLIREGALVVDKDSDLGDASGGLGFGSDAALGNTNGTLRFASGFDLSAGRAVELRDGGGTVDTQGFNTGIAQTIGGTGALTKTGSGTLTLSGVNGYVGGTILEQGVLGVNADSALGAGGSRLVMYDAVTLRLDGSVASLRPVTLAGGPTAKMTIDTQGNDGVFAGRVDGLGGLVKSGSGLLALYGNNLYQGGTLAQAGTLAVNSDAALGGLTGPLDLWNGTTLRLDGNTDMRSRTLTLGGGNAASPAVTIDTQNFTGVIRQNIGQNIGQNGGPTRLDKTGTGVLALYGENAYGGGTWVRNGTAAIRSVAGLGGGATQLGDHENAAQEGSGSTAGALRADADLEFGAGRAVYLNQGGGIIDTNGYAVTMAENTLRDGATGGPADQPGRDLRKAGARALTLLNNQYYSGRTFIDQGDLRLDAVDPGPPTSNSRGLLNTTELTIAAGARLEGQGVVGNALNAQIGDPLAPAVGPADFATVVNNGVIAPGLERFHNSFDDAISQFVPLTLAGNYRAGKGAVVEIHTELLDDASRHGTLTISGVIDPASDPAGTGIRVIHQGGDGATTNRGIEIIRLLGEGSGADQAELIRQLDENFHLISDFRTAGGQNAVVAGAYTYVLESDVDWYGDSLSQGGLFLRNCRNPDGSRVLNPATPLYESYLMILGSLNRPPTLEQRVGHRLWLNGPGPEAGGSEAAAQTDRRPGRDGSGGLWMRMEGSTGRYKPKLGSGGNASYDLHFGRMNLGLDAPLYENDGGSRLVAGLNGNISRAKADIEAAPGNGDVSATGYGLGAALTWYDRSGFYADLQARHTWFDSDISSSSITSASYQVEGNDAKGYAFSLELGRIFNLDPRWSLTPQAQLTYSHVEFDAFTDSQNSAISNKKPYESLDGRLGLALNYERSYRDASGATRRNKLYFLGNAYHEFKGKSAVGISGVTYQSELSATWLGLGIGGSHNWSDDRFSVYGEAGARSSTRKFGDEYELTGEVGLRIAF